MLPVRSREHVEGLWAIHIFINIDPGHGMKRALGELADFYNQAYPDAVIESIIARESDYFDLCTGQNRYNSLHISLSKTLRVQFHHIQPLINDLQDVLMNYSEFDVAVDYSRIIVLVNESKTRSFLSSPVVSGTGNLGDIVENINTLLMRYRLVTFYSLLVFHCSFAWSNHGGLREWIETHEALNLAGKHKLGIVYHKVQSIIIKYGHLSKTIPLKHPI